MTQAKRNSGLIFLRIMIIGVLIADIFLFFIKGSILNKSLAMGSFLIFFIMLILSFKVNKSSEVY